MPWIQIEFQSCRWLRRKQKGCTSIPNFSREFSFSFAVIFVLFLITNKTMWRARIFFNDLSENSFSQYKLINHMSLPFYTKWDFLLILCFADGLVSIFGWKIIVSHFCVLFLNFELFQKIFYLFVLFANKITFRRISVILIVQNTEKLPIPLRSLFWTCFTMGLVTFTINFFIVSDKNNVKCEKMNTKKKRVRV